MSENSTTETERLERVRMLVESAPEGVDVESLLAGSLAGSESPDRPDVPVWEYLEYEATHPDVTLHDLGAVRFPVRTSRGDSFPTSIDEMLKPGPGRAAEPLTRHDIIDLYAVLHEAGLVRWDAANRTIVRVDVPLHDVAAAHTAWRDRIAERHGVR